MFVPDVLDELGCKTLEATDPQSALAVIESGSHFDLIITVVGLPGMNGRQLAEIARKHLPDLPILYITGYAQNAEARGGFPGRNVDMITKPFPIEVLAGKIREMPA